MHSFRRVTALLTGAAMLPVIAPLGARAENHADAQTIREYSEIFVSLVNDARVEVGLSEVYLTPVLCDYSQIRSNELAVSFSHERPDGQRCFSVMKNDGFFYNLAAENIAAGNPSPVETFKQFMNSTDHRNNILTDGMTHIGFSYCYDPDSVSMYNHFWQMFIIGTYDAMGTQVIYEGQYIPEREVGDADGSKEINAADAARIMQFSAARSAGASPNVTDAFRTASDINGDGQINAVDAQILLAYCCAKGADPAAELTDFIWS